MHRQVCRHVYAMRARTESSPVDMPGIQPAFNRCWAELLRIGSDAIDEVLPFFCFLIRTMMMMIMMTMLMLTMTAAAAAATATTMVMMTDDDDPRQQSFDVRLIAVHKLPDTVVCRSFKRRLIVVLNSFDSRLIVV